jgi:hypothetical protein
MMKVLMVAVAVVAAAADTAAAGQAIERAPARKPVVAPRTTSVRVAVRDKDGASLPDVHLVLSGAGAGEFTTGAAGTAVMPNITDGLYRVRCEREGFVTLEREFTVRGGAWNPIDIVLNSAPPPPPVIKEPEPPPAPSAVAASGPPVTMSIPDFLDRNFIGGREPIKESVIACKPLETVRLLQMRDAVAKHVHDRLDEVIYVVAGEGTIHIGEAATPLRAGSLVVVPNGSGHSFERSGKNPLIVVSTLSGSACEAPKSTQ